MTSAHTRAKPRKLKRFDLWLSKKREIRAYKQGKLPSVLPFVGYGSTTWLRVLGRTILMKPEKSAETGYRTSTVKHGGIRGWRYFMSVSAPKEEVKLFLGNTEIGTAVSDQGGVLDAKFSAQLTPGWHNITYVTSAGITSSAPVYIAADTANFGIISDVDDTVLNTMLPKPFVAAWNSFVLSEQARLAVPGMPVLFDHIRHTHPGAPVIYLSTGAWNIAHVLERFLKRHMYPMGPLLLTDWGPTHDRWFRSGKEHKHRELRRLATEFPDIKWLLIGDDGQHDEEIYARFTAEHPENVAAVAIRQLTTSEAVLAGGRSQAEKHLAVSGVPWVYGPDGSTLRKELAKLGLL